MINIVKYKPFIEVETFNDFKTLKLSVDNTNSIYITYENDKQTYGTPDVLYGQFVFIKDSGIIYLKGHFFTDKEFILSSEYEVSKLERENLSLQSGDTFEEAFGKIEKTIIDNELTLAYTINDLNQKISYTGNGGNNSVLSSEYEVSKLERENLLLQSGDTFEEAFGKIEKTIIDNELSLAYTLNDLNYKISYSGKDLVLSSEYEISSLYSYDLLLKSGDTFEEAFGKIEKTIIDNELTTSRALNNLNKKFSISDKYQLSELERDNLLLKSGDTFEEAFGKIEKTIADNELSLAYALNDLNNKISYSGKDLVLSSEYKISELERDNLLLKSGDTFEEAFGKIEKTITDNELTLAYTINDLNIKVNDIQQKTLGLPNITSSDNGKILMVVNGEWQLTTPTMVYNGTELPNNSNGNNGDLYIQTNE